MVSVNGVINNKVGSTNSGQTNTFTVTNPSNTASSAARETITVGGGTASDPTLNFKVTGVTDWEMGIDNSDSDKLKVSQGTALGTNDTLVAFTTGQVLFPRTPAFFAKVSATQANVTGDGTIYSVIFDTETQDIGSNYNNATGVFTAPVSGSYTFSMAVNFNNLTMAHNAGNLELLVNGTDRYHLSGGNPFVPATASGDMNWNGSISLPLTATDTVTAIIQVSGSTKTINVLGTTAIPGGIPSHFSGFLLG